MVGGIVLFAFGLETALHDTTTSLALVPAFGLFGGIALYLVAHVALRLRIGGGLGRGRPIASLVLLGSLPAAIHVPASAALGMVAAVSVALIAYEVIRHREGRAAIRVSRGALRAEDIATFDDRRRRT
jgi:low temperature requirement protein LtrA